MEILKTYARLYLAAGFGPALNEEFTEAGNAFNEAYMGSSGALSLEDSAAQYVQQVMSDYLGQAYVDRYFSQRPRRMMEKMVRTSWRFTGTGLKRGLDERDHQGKGH